MKAIFNLLMFWSRVARKYDYLKKDPEKSEKSVSLGITSLILSILGIALTVGFAVLAFICFSNLDSGAFILPLVGAIFSTFAAIGCFVDLVLASIVYAVYQMKLNKKPIGKAALVISLLITVATIVVVIIALTQF